jgi:hypothetical protein
MTTALSKQQASDLRACEQIINNGMMTFRKVGQALCKIRDDRLYKSSHKSFEAYCNDRWNFGRSYAARLIQAADVPEVLWAVFDSSMQLHLYTQVVSDEEKAEHIAACEAWLNSIELGMTPSGVKWSYETINRRYAKPEARTVELPSDTTELVARLKHVKAELKSYQELEDQLKAGKMKMKRKFLIF